MSIGIQVWLILQYLNWEINLNIFLKFYQILLLLFGDISLNSGPCQMQFIDDKTWEPLKTRGLHFCHLNVNSLLSNLEISQII